MFQKKTRILEKLRYQKFGFKARFHYERGKKHSLFVLLLFFCARFNFNRSLQSKINKNALFHARSGNGPLNNYFT